MRFGYCVNMIADDPSGIGYGRLHAISQAGFDYAELPIAQIMELSEHAFRTEILGGLVHEGLPCLCCNNFFPATHRLTGEDAKPDKALDYAAAAFERMARMGAQRVVFGSSGARNAPSGFCREAAMAQLRRLLSSIGQLAAAHSMDVVIEPLNRAESNLINSVTEALTLAREVAHPRIRVLADTYHMEREHEPFGTVLRAGSLLGHLHAAKPPQRTLPLSDDDELPALFQALQTIGYTGTLSIEAYITPAVSIDALAAVCQRMRRLDTKGFTEPNA